MDPAPDPRHDEAVKSPRATPSAEAHAAAVASLLEQRDSQVASVSTTAQTLTDGVSAATSSGVTIPTDPSPTSSDGTLPSKPKPAKKKQTKHPTSVLQLDRGHGETIASIRANAVQLAHTLFASASSTHQPLPITAIDPSETSLPPLAAVAAEPVPAVAAATAVDHRHALFLGKREMFDLLDAEEHRHTEEQHIQQLVQLHVWRGEYATAIQIAQDAGQLDASLIALSPLAGLDIWRKATIAYAQKLAQQGETVQAALHFLAVDQPLDAIECYSRGKMFREALALARMRLNPLQQQSVSRKIHLSWATLLEVEGNFEQAAKCHLALGAYRYAAQLLARRGDVPALDAAIDICTTAAIDSTPFIEKLAQLHEAAGNTSHAVRVLKSSAVQHRIYPLLANLARKDIHPASATGQVATEFEQLLVQHDVGADAHVAAALVSLQAEHTTHKSLDTSVELAIVLMQLHAGHHELAASSFIAAVSKAFQRAEALTSDGALSSQVTALALAVNWPDYHRFLSPDSIRDMSLLQGILALGLADPTSSDLPIESLHTVTSACFSDVGIIATTLEKIDGLVQKSWTQVSLRQRIQAAASASKPAASSSGSACTAQEIDSFRATNLPAWRARLTDLVQPVFAAGIASTFTEARRAVLEAFVCETRQLLDLPPVQTSLSNLTYLHDELQLVLQPLRLLSPVSKIQPTALLPVATSVVFRFASFPEVSKTEEPLQRQSQALFRMFQLLQ
ncbi:hypothetical protein CAOG_006494 [Capsaspora owczarzaki ATCC 30864]|uniref:Gem-associated protein 5 TPR domain-containing protein n=2 Tax=Capsaspora owczarzaki (strain ATCC 30864) TaxID=595528 RepID=A0A0D2UM37_CAPO3|nr:hypothetical protein CAOG_006494 [Capsaspora owczarzaki ATCC 30864]